MQVYSIIDTYKFQNKNNFRGKLENKSILNSAKDWNKFVGKNIPSSLELSPIIFKYIKYNDNICDVGMGFGKTIFELYKKGFNNLSGIDSNISGINFANKIIKDYNLTGKFNFIIGNAADINLKNESQNVTITQAFWTTITNLSDRKKILKEINRILKNSGILYISDFGQTPSIPIYNERYNLGLIKGYEKGTFEVINSETGNLEYLAHHYTKDEFTELLKCENFKIEEYVISPVKTRSGNTIDGHTIIARKMADK